MKTTHGSFTRSAGAPIHHHRGSCHRNIRRKYSFSSFFLLFTWAVASEVLKENILFFRHLCSHLKNISKKDISYFTYSLHFFLILTCGHELLLSYFCLLFFSSYVYGWTEKFSSQFAQSVWEILWIFLLSQNFFLLLCLWMDRERENISTEFARSVWEILWKYLLSQNIFSPPTSLDEQKKKKKSQILQRVYGNLRDSRYIEIW